MQGNFFRVNQGLTLTRHFLIPTASQPLPEAPTEPQIRLGQDLLPHPQHYSYLAGSFSLGGPTLPGSSTQGHGVL